MQVPEPGAGTVSLNKVSADNNVVVPQKTTATAIPEVAPVSPDPTTPEPTYSLDSEPVAQLEDMPINTDTQQEGISDLSIPVDPTADLEEGTEVGGSKLKVWGSLLVGSVAVLVAVFFYLANETTLFQGSLDVGIVSPEETQTIFEQGNGDGGSVADQFENPNPVIDLGTDNGNQDLPIIDEPGQQVGEGGPIVDPSVDGNFVLDPTGDPEFTDAPVEITDSLPIATDEPVLIIDEPAVPVVPVVSQPIEPQPAPVTGINGTLTSNTNPTVLASANVQGDTGPGVLLYLLAPGMVLVRRRFK